MASESGIDVQNFETVKTMTSESGIDVQNFETTNLNGMSCATDQVSHGHYQVLDFRSNEPGSPITAKVEDQITSPDIIISKSDVEMVDGKEKKIPRPMNSFMLFAHDNRRKLKSLYPRDDNKNISVRLGKAWRELDLLEKQRYFDQAQEVERLHKEKYPNYTYSPGVARRRKANRRLSTPAKPQQYPRPAASTQSANQMQVMPSVPEKPTFIQQPAPIAQQHNPYLFNNSPGTSSTATVASPYIAKPFFQNTAPAMPTTLLPCATLSAEVPSYSPRFQLGVFSPTLMTTGPPARVFPPYLGFSAQSGLSHIGIVGGQGDTDIRKLTTAHMTLPVQAYPPVTQMQYIAPVPVCSSWVPSSSSMLPTITSFHNVNTSQHQFGQNPNILQPNIGITGLQQQRNIQSIPQPLRLDHDYAASVPLAGHAKDNLQQTTSPGVILAAPEAGDAGMNSIRSVDASYLLANIYNVPCGAKCQSLVTGSCSECGVEQMTTLSPTGKRLQHNNSIFMQVGKASHNYETMMPCNSTAVSNENIMATTNDNFSPLHHFMR